MKRERKIGEQETLDTLGYQKEGMAILGKTMTTNPDPGSRLSYP